MNHRILVVVAIALLIGFQPLYAQENAEAVVAEEASADAVPVRADEAVGRSEGTEPAAVPFRIRNNRYFQASQRFYRLAEGAYNFGDYDSSTGYSQEAIRYAVLSDEYVALQMKIREANNAIAAAKSRIDWAVSSGASRQYPSEFQEAESWYNISLKARIGEEWDNAIDAAHRVVELLAYISAPGAVAEKAVVQDDGLSPLPATYTVRTWVNFRDCLWNIAGYSWAYGDPYKWRLLYDANKSKLSNPNNPDLIQPGMVLDIPSLKGETRQGSWDESKKYDSIR